MNDKDKATTAKMHDAQRMELALTVPQEVLVPIMMDIASRRSDEAICIINSADQPGGANDLAHSLITVLRREALSAALGNKVPSLMARKVGHIPFVVIDRHGTTVVQVEEPVRCNSLGGSA